MEVRQRGTNAVPIERAPPKYPKSAIYKGTEGWVLVSFVVNTDGSTRDIEILDTSIADFFDKPSLGAVERWIYKPATLNGQPVSQAKTNVRLVFTLEGSGGKVSRSFLRKYKTADRAIKNGDLEKAKKTIDILDARKQSVLAEVCYLDILKAMYWQKKGNENEALHSYTRALTIADDSASKEIYIIVLKQSFVLSVRQNFLVNALSNYETLLSVDGALPPDDPIRRVARQVQDYLDSDKPFSVQGKVWKSCKTCQESRPFWRHTLYRNRFSIDQIEGAISEFKLLCGFKYVTIAYAPGTSWNIEDDWGQCDIHVYGDVGSAFRLTEL